MEVPLLCELNVLDEDLKATRNFSSIMCKIKRIASLTKDFPKGEKTDKYMFQYLRSSVAF